MAMTDARFSMINVLPSCGMLMATRTRALPSHQSQGLRSVQPRIQVNLDRACVDEPSTIRSARAL
ncbi:hypothetical protein AG1IA_05741 [Rhizoctonia solani AG-1 IA]|uniref:Uncharacterized protein n=1 Tax=Thanatephorus cucumeris (strain AG1-IA) TaxID=983506 RepID=L8WTW7_THACA|nr:hypothetical protein AG1IA_05741 [Rhizoctonia solani AG-1 IA]